MLTVERKVESVSQSMLGAVDATPGWLSLDEATLLFNPAKQVTAGSIVEVGSYRGRSTVALALGAMAGGNRPVYAIEPHEEFTGYLGGAEFGPEDRGAFFQSMLRTSCYRNVRLVNLSSEIIAPGWKESVSLLWLDGNHSYDGVKRDFGCWKDHLSASAHIAFDDAMDERLGPSRLISELLLTEAFGLVSNVGKVVVIKPL